MLRPLAYTLSSLLAASITIWGTIHYSILPHLPSQQEILNLQLQVPLQVLAQDGSLIAEFGEKRRDPIPYGEIPQQMIHAIIAAEDEHYFDHPGVDSGGILRAAYRYLSSGEKREGGSTITMQMARNFFLSREKSWRRKIMEIALAIRIEQLLEKEEILSLYLNKIFFGHRSYGIGAAFHTYYGISPAEATLAQVAMVAALPKAPSTINPIRNPKRARERRDYILGRMATLGFITREEQREAVRSPLSATLHHPPVETEAPYAAEMVRAELVRLLGKSVAYTSGIRVTTTIRPALQASAVNALRNSIRETRQRVLERNQEAERSWPPSGQAEGAIVALNPNSGAIVALSGGSDFSKTPFNRATQAYRQMGSTIKPLIYTAALQQGMTAATLLNDAPLLFPGTTDSPPWRPENSGHRFHGPTLLQDALIHSRNLASIRLLQKSGFRPVLEHLKRVGLAEERINRHRDLTLAVGTLPATPLEVATAYAPFANGGYRLTPWLIDSITFGNRFPTAACRLCNSNRHPPLRLLSPQVHYLMDQMLRRVIQQGTARRARVLEREDIGGKTGTSNRSMDTWFAGYHPDLVAVSWIGYDQPRSLGMDESGAETALPMWIRFMRDALHNHPEKRHPRPEGMITLHIDPITGKQADAAAKRKRLLTFRKGLEPRPAPRSRGGRSLEEIRQLERLLW